MSEMLRKQIYITRRQQAMLKRLAQQRGISEAEIIRQAIDREAANSTRRLDIGSEEAWEKAYQFMLSLKDRAGWFSKPYIWDREELYEERMRRIERRDESTSTKQD